MNSLLHPNARTPLYRLLGGWRGVLDDIRTLCRDLQDLPDACQCGHEPGHLQGSCPCCGTITTARVPNCDDCERQLAALRPALDQLAADAYRFFPIIDEVMTHDDPSEGTRARDIERHIGALLHSFEELVMAEGQFRADCRASHLQTLKHSAVALRRDAESLNRLVSPQPENRYVKD